MAESFKNQGLFTRAYKFYFRARNEIEVIGCMEKVMKAGYESEQDLFVARACIDMLQRSKEISKAKAIRDHFKEIKDADGAPSPILNFVDFLIVGIEYEEIELIG